MRASRELAAMTKELAAARLQVNELESRLSRASGRDPLAETMLSLRAFRVQLELEVQRSHRYGRPLTLLLLDLDDFRRTNLERGYVAGDLILAAVGKQITATIRSHDLGCRTGGDEFAVLFSETSPEAAVHATRRLLSELESIDVGGVNGISASAGVASFARGQSSEALMARAREALELAREKGPGNVIFLDGVSETGDAVSSELNGHGGAVAALASALSARDRYTGDHSESVVDLTARVGEGLALKPSDIEQIRMAALLHDIGKVGVPDATLNKPGPLDEAEWEIMHEHPVIGERILQAIPGMGAIAKIVRHEHERWDGGGYPDGLAATEIPVGARIILACDAYHAMTSDRPYRKSIAHTEAVKQLSSNAGSQFDPDVVEVLVGYLFGRRQSGLALA